VQPKIIFESGQFSSIFSMVCAGLGVSIIPAMALEKRNGCQFVRWPTTAPRGQSAQLR